MKRNSLFAVALFVVVISFAACTKKDPSAALSTDSSVSSSDTSATAAPKTEAKSDTFAVPPGMGKSESAQIGDLTASSEGLPKAPDAKNLAKGVTSRGGKHRAHHRRGHGKHRRHRRHKH